LAGNLADPLGGSVGDSRERPKQQDPGEPFGPPGSALDRMPGIGFYRRLRVALSL